MTKKFTQYQHDAVYVHNMLNSAKSRLGDAQRNARMGGFVFMKHDLKECLFHINKALEKGESMPLRRDIETEAAELDEVFSGDIEAYISLVDDE